MSNCTLIQNGVDEAYTPNPFENTGNIKFYHNNVPRFGNTNEIMHLLQGTSNQQQEYIQGLLSSPIALAVVIIAWIIILWVFNCCRFCCCRDHDWLAGKPVQLPQEPASKGEDDDDDEEESDVEKSSVDGPVVELTVFKENQGARTGLKLGQNRHGDLIALRVDPKGLFFGKLQVGQRIISIHGSPPENNEHTDDGDNGGARSSKGKDLMQKMGNGTQNLVETIKQKTKGNNMRDNNEESNNKDKVAEATKTLRDSVGKLTLAVESRVHKVDVKYAEWKNEYDRVLQQKTIFKSIVAFSLFVLFITGIVLCSAGVNGLESAIDTGVETLYIVEGRMKQGVEFLDDALRLNQLINDDVNSLLVSLNGICPASGQICSDLKNPNSCQSISGLSIVSEMKKAISYIQDDTTHEQVIQDARRALNDIVTQTAGIDTDLDPVDRTLAGILAFGVIVILISIFLGLVLFMPMPALVRSILFWLSYGLLFVIILFGFLLLLVVLPVSSAVGDACYDDPGSRIETILRDNTDTSSSVQVQDMVFNIFKGCSAPEARLNGTIDFQTEGIGVFGSFDSAIAELKQNSAVCGTPASSIATVETTLNNIVNVHLCQTFNILTEFSDFFTCRFWHPIYAQAAHESMCYQGMDALSAITNTLFVILCMSLLIMTFRVALWDALRSPLQKGASNSKDEEIENNDKTRKTQDKDQSDDVANAENTTPKKKKKKKKRKPKHRTLEEGMGEDQDATHKTHEWDEAGPNVQGDEGEGATGVDGELPKQKTVKANKGPKKKKKKKKKVPSQQDGGGQANEDAAVEGESEIVEGQGPDGIKKKKKKKKKVPSQQDGEGQAKGDAAVEGENEIVEAQGTAADAGHPDGIKKKLKKKKKKKIVQHTEDVDGAPETRDAIQEDLVV